MLDDLPAHRLEEFAPLSEIDRAALRRIAQPHPPLPRNTVIRREGEAPDYVYLLIDGWVTSSLLLPDGKRQVIKLHLPGDIMGTPSMCLRAAVDTLATVTSARISRVPIPAFLDMMGGSARFATCMFLSTQKERVALIDQLTAIGRTSAKQRVAGFLLDIADRLRPLGKVVRNSFDLPVTQEVIGDYLGLTPVHVNRTFRSLDADRVISRSGRQVTILDLDTLRHLRASRTRQLAPLLGLPTLERTG